MRIRCGVHPHLLRGRGGLGAGTVRHGRVCRLFHEGSGQRRYGGGHRPHAGENADLPPQWLTTIVVEDLEASLRRCTERGGTQVTAMKGAAGEQRYCVIQDPAGAYLARMELGTA